MSIDCYVTPSKRKALKIAKSFAAGIGTLPLEPGCTYKGRDAFFYGMTSYTFGIKEGVKQTGNDWYYADNAYYFGRGKYFRVSRNDWWTHGLGNAGPERFERFGLEPKPWRSEGHIVIATQSDLFYRMFEGMSRNDWVSRLKKTLAKHTDRPVYVANKPEPKDRSNFPHGPFEALLPNAYAVVTHSSSCAVAAMLDGVPVFAMRPCFASPVALTNALEHIEEPYYPTEGERLQWLYNLAAAQWTPQEMASGQCWHELKQESLA